MNGISWKLYRQLLAEVGDGHQRFTYDRGRLEIISSSPFHEQTKKVIARLIDAYADEAAISIEGLGSTTFSDEDLAKSLEPDECFYIARAHVMIGKREIDLAIDPPPDPTIEIDISPPDFARQPIYAARGVPRCGVITAENCNICTARMMRRTTERTLVRHSPRAHHKR